MDHDQIKKIVEVFLFVSDKPLPIEHMVKALDGVDSASIRKAIEDLNADFAATNRSFSIIEVGGGFQIMTDPFYAPYVRKLFTRERKHRLSAPSLETLAIVAYKQPVTRADIEAIRGVNIEGVLEKLLERNVIRVVGRKDIPGRPFMYGTTKNFLTHFGLNSLEDLPKLRDFGENDIELGRDELIKKEGEEVQDEEIQTEQADVKEVA
jgi:segregation and condensation protein B